MKTFAGVMVLLLLILIGAGFYSAMLKRDVNRLNQRIEDIEGFVRNHDWDKGRNLLEDFTNDWQTTKKRLEIFMNHKEMDLINEAISDVRGYARFENTEEFLVHTGLLKMLLEHIPEVEKISPENIL